MSKSRILIIEDDADIREAFNDLLTSDGYEVVTAINGQEGIDCLRKDPGFSLIFLDLMMPVKDGFQFRKEQMEDHQIAHIPVVIMSADGHVEEKRARTSAEAYLRKPIDISDVLDTAKKYARPSTGK